MLKWDEGIIEGEEVVYNHHGFEFKVTPHDQGNYPWSFTVWDPRGTEYSGGCNTIEQAKARAIEVVRRELMKAIAELEG